MDRVERMNERINQLRLEAGISRLHNEPKFMVAVSKEGQVIKPLDGLEKFAELIVRECIKESMEEIVADDDIAQEKDPLIQEYLKGNNQGIVDAVVRFRNHFGVEE